MLEVQTTVDRLLPAFHFIENRKIQNPLLTHFFALIESIHNIRAICLPTELIIELQLAGHQNRISLNHFFLLEEVVQKGLLRGYGILFSSEVNDHQQFIGIDVDFICSMLPLQVFVGLFIIHTQIFVVPPSSKVKVVAFFGRAFVYFLFDLPQNIDTDAYSISN